MKTPISPSEAYNRIASICALGERCSSDMRDKLLSWGLPETDCDNIIARLVEEHFIDDTRFAGAFTRDKAKYQGWGKRKISYELHRKGIDANTIADALCTINDEEYTDTLRSILTQKLRAVHSKEPRLQRQALLRLGASRGFDTALLYRMVNDIMGSASCYDDTESLDSDIDD